MNNSIAARNKRKLIEVLKEYQVWGMALEKVVDYLYTETDFFYAPASTKYHGAYPGGLFDHSLYTMRCLVELGRDWGSKMSPYIVGLLHDLTKVNKYRMEIEAGEIPAIKYCHNPDWVERSSIHGEDSVNKVKNLINLSEEEELCIRFHMGAYETGDWDEFDRAIRKYPNVLWTHTADMYASKVLEG